MKFSKQSLAVTAALAGLVGGTTARAAQPVNPTPSQFSLGIAADEKGNAQLEKHACKGLNSCKGMGGGSEKEWGKNECKGKGACATDGSKAAMNTKKK
jgi:hypothetical protein